MSPVMRILLTLLLSVSLAHASVQEICGLDQPAVSLVKNADQLRSNICQLTESANDQEITSTAAQSLEILRRLETQPAAPSENGEAPGDPLNNNELVGSLDQVGALLTARRSPAQFSTSRNDETARALTQLFTRYGTEAQRRADGQGYYQTLRSVLSRTQEGTRVLRCFEGPDDKVTGTAVEYMEADAAGPTATFEPRYNEATNDYTKVITLNLKDNPTLMLSLLSHEMQHSCNTAEDIRIAEQDRAARASFEALMTREPPAPDEEMARVGNELVNLQNQSNVRAAIDELRAYRMTPAVFRELAPYAPSYFCDRFYASGLFGRQILSNGQYLSTIETMVADGSFPYQLIDQYTQIAGYDPNSFFEVDESTGDLRRNSEGRPIFKASVRAELEREGFRVQ